MSPETSFGSKVKRKEDHRLITGQAKFVDDIKLPGMKYAVFARSNYGHARITVNTEKAEAAPGVEAVFTGRDLDGEVAPIPTAWLIPDSDLKTPPRPPLAIDKVRYAGEAVAVVIANTREEAYDAAALVEVSYEEVAPVMDLKGSLEAESQLHEEAPNNRAFHWKVQNGEIDQAFENAHVVVKQNMTNHRLIPVAMETRGCVARSEPASDNYTLWLTSQNPHIHRHIISAVLGVSESKIRVIAQDVGGGFGSKIACYPEEVVITYCSGQLNTPIKWIEDRRENFVATTHGRDHVVELEMAADSEGKITAIRGTCYANLGAYLSTAAPGVPTILHGFMMAGCYKIPAIDYQVYGVFTNTCPIDAYRGAGRPEALYYVERMVDLVAGELGVDPLEVRRKNFIQKDEFPYEVTTGLVYDSGDYELALDRALEKFDYGEFRQFQKKAREEGRLVGVGFSTYVEICGLGPSEVAGATGFQGGLWESAVVRVHPTGKVTVMTGTNPHGQGEKTTFSQIVADELGVAVDDVEVLHGDTDIIPMGWGTYGSRTTAVGGAALAVALEKVMAKARKVAAHVLECTPEEIDFKEGEFFVSSQPDQRKTIQEIAGAANLAWSLPEGMEPGLEANAFYDPPNFVYPFGTHICTVEIDRDTGKVEITRYLCVDDCGPLINPMIVEGQVHGGVVQGLAQALYEYAVYDEEGQLQSGSLMDYAVPRAHQVPSMETDHTITPSPHHPLGVKGVGETGTIAATAAIGNAVADALKPLGIEHLDMPFTPERVWRAMEASQQSQG